MAKCLCFDSLASLFKVFILGLLVLMLVFDNFNSFNIFISEPLKSGKMHNSIETVIFHVFIDFSEANISKWRNYAQLIFSISQIRYIKQCLLVHFKGDIWGQF